MEIDEIGQLPLTDEEQLSMLVEAGEEGAAELIEELLGLFQSEAAPQLGMVKDAVGRRMAAEASRPAHAIAGSSANLGGLRLAKLAKAMELAANQDDFTRLDALLPALDMTYEATVTVFEEEIARLRSN